MTFAGAAEHERRGQERREERERFRREVFDGLGRSPKTISPKWFYDRRGSALFDEICALPEYYVTRTELGLLERHTPEIVAACGRDVRLVEPGAGSSTKTALLLHALGPSRCREYVPVDISREHLEASAARLRRAFPWLRVSPKACDFVRDALPRGLPTARTVVYFPGSTLGNFEPHEASALLSEFRGSAGAHGVVVLGLDLKKDPNVLHAAYNDSRGVTARFNKNLLVRINRELGGDIEVSSFAHYAFYEPRQARVEMHLVSLKPQTVSISGRQFRFGDGESIRTECSHKYDLDSVRRLAGSAGLRLSSAWTDGEAPFAIVMLEEPCA